MFVSETYSIEDCKFYDSANSDQTSRYGLVAFEGTTPTISHSNDGYYSLNPRSSKTGGVTIPSAPTKLEVTFKQTNTSHYGGIGVTTGNGNGIGILANNSQPYCYINGSWQSSSNRPPVWNNDIRITTHWYTMTVEKTGTTLYITCKDLDTGVTYTGSTTMKSEFENGELCLFCSGSASTYVKEIKAL